MNQSLEHYEILLGISGGIAAYKACTLCSELVRRDAGVSVAMTDHAVQFVGPLTFQTLTGRPVYSDLFQTDSNWKNRHIALTALADLIVVAPATANIIAKLANGICDDLLSTLLCSADSPVLLAPAMNERMWNHPATRHNIDTLTQRGCLLIGPETGRLACGDTGIGRMAEPDNILNHIIDLLSKQTPKNKKS